MPRATIIISADVPEEREAGDQWFNSWRAYLTFVSEYSGCGCCVDIYDVEGSQVAIDALPPRLSARSDWSHPKVSAPNVGAARKLP